MMSYKRSSDTSSPLAALLGPIPSTSRSPQPEVVLLQAAHNTHLPLVHALLQASLSSKHAVLVVTFDVPRSYFARGLQDGKGQGRSVILDYSGRVPGYELGGEEEVDVSEEALAAAKTLPPGPATIAVLGLDTYVSDTTSATAYRLLKSLHSTLTSRPSSRLLIPLTASSPLADILLPPTALSSDMTHLLLHPPSLLSHLSSQFLTLPPPYGDSRKFWALFEGAAERGEGVRARKVGIEQGLVECRVRKRSRVERTLEAWKEVEGDVRACSWEELTGMKEMVDAFARTGQVQTNAPTSTADPTSNLPFNLTLTPAQSQARAAVPLPYAHTNSPPQNPTQTGEILYEPDSGDDVDDDDPDEDLDI